MRQEIQTVQRPVNLNPKVVAVLELLRRAKKRKLDKAGRNR